MLAAFEDMYSSIVPFRNVLEVDLDSSTSIRCQSDSKTFKLVFENKEIRDQQLANFKQWLTIKSNSI